jgi:hypothetical protein
MRGRVDTEPTLKRLWWELKEGIGERRELCNDGAGRRDGVLIRDRKFEDDDSERCGC